MKICVSLVFCVLFAFAKEGLMEEFLEEGFDKKQSFHGAWNDKNIKLTRFTTTNKLNFEGEHISFVFDDEKNLYALARMLICYKKRDDFSLSKDEAKEIATAFLRTYAPSLLQNYKILWIDFHDETLSINGDKITIEGLKVKCQNLDDKKYFWVIVGNDKSVMVFERDVIWDFLRVGRQTQKWIHDSWLKKEIK